MVRGLRSGADYFTWFRPWFTRICGSFSLLVDPNDWNYFEMNEVVEDGVAVMAA